MNHNNRKGKFTSSEIFKLIKSGRGNDFSIPGMTYIKEKQIELKLGRCLSLNEYSQAISWGHLMEKVLYEKLQMPLRLIHEETRLHPEKEFKDYWSGTPDFEIPEVLITEAKCFQLKNFALYSDMLMKQDIELFKIEFPKEYWQIVSNCIINNVPIGDAISFMPYKEDLQKIREEIEDSNFLEMYDFDPWKFRFIVEKPIEDLPYVEKGGYFKNITRFRFTVPQEDKEYLTERVREAKKLLIKYQEEQ